MTNDFFKAWVTLSSLVLLLCTVHVTGETIQQLTFYKNEGCLIGDDKLTIFTTTEFELTSWVREAKSFKILGLWTIKLLNLTTTNEVEGHSLTSRTLGQQAPTEACYSSDIWKSSTQEQIKYVGAEIIGPSNLTHPQIIFYQTSSFQRKEFVVMGDSKVLPGVDNPQVIEATLLISDQNWIGYSELDFEGYETCFCPNLNATRQMPKAGFTLNQLRTSDAITIGSVKKDVDGECAEKCSSVKILSAPFFIILAFLFVSKSGFI